MEENKSLNSAALSLLAELGIDGTYSSPGLLSMSATDSKYLRDLKLNVTAVMKSKHLTGKEAGK